jgi:hypothetical protein
VRLKEPLVDITDKLKSVLKSQYHAALALLRETLERCPDDVWSSAEHLNSWATKFWWSIDRKDFNEEGIHFLARNVSSNCVGRGFCSNV